MVLIMAPNGKSFALDVNPNATTLHDLKVAIEQHNGTPVSNQHLFLSQSLGQNDSNIISNLGIGPFSTLTLHVPSYGDTTTPPSIVAPADNTIGATSSAAKEEELDKEESDKDEDDYVGCHPDLRRIMKRPCAEMEELKQARLKKDLEEIAIQMDRYFEEELEKDMEKIKKSREDRNKWIENFKKARKEKIAKEGKEDDESEDD